MSSLSLLPTLPLGTFILSDLQRGAPFLYGQLRHVQTMGPYALVTYHPLHADRSPDTTQVRYFGFVDGQPCGRAASSIDAALAMCIALRHQGNGHYADTLFMSLLRLPA